MQLDLQPTPVISGVAQIARQPRSGAGWRSAEEPLAADAGALGGR
jgi:hypothetical protein